MKILKLLPILLIFFVRAYGQGVDYDPEILSENHILKISELNITRLGDTVLQKRLTFDSLGRVILLEDDFQCKNEPYLIDSFTYKEQLIDLDHIEIISKKHITKLKVISGGDMKWPKKNSVINYGSDNNIILITNSDLKDNITSIKFYYNTAGLVIRQEFYKNKIFENEMIFVYQK